MHYWYLALHHLTLALTADLLGAWRRFCGLLLHWLPLISIPLPLSWSLNVAQVATGHRVVISRVVLLLRLSVEHVRRLLLLQLLNQVQLLPLKALLGQDTLQMIRCLSYFSISIVEGLHDLLFSGLWLESPQQF